MHIPDKHLFSFIFILFINTAEHQEAAVILLTMASATLLTIYHRIDSG